MPFYLEMSKNITQQRDIYDTVIFRFLQIFYGLLKCLDFCLSITLRVIFKWLTKGERRIKYAGANEYMKNF